MATKTDVQKALTNTSMKQGTGLADLLESDKIKARFNAVLGKKAAAFSSSILSLYNTKQEMKGVEPMTIVTSAMIAATLDLPINPSLGFAHIVPYNGRAQFQMGWKGFVQLAIRTGQYKTMNAAPVYEGELKFWNRITGDIDIDINSRSGDKVIGYVAFFRLLNGFEKYHYMTREEAEKHGRRYSKAFDSKGGRWQQDFDAMALKTVLKMLLSKYGILSVEMQKALQADQAVVSETLTGEAKFDYPDNESIDAELSEPEKKEMDNSIDATAQEDIPFGR